MGWGVCRWNLCGRIESLGNTGFGFDLGHGAIAQRAAWKGGCSQEWLPHKRQRSQGPPHQRVQRFSSLVEHGQSRYLSRAEIFWKSGFSIPRAWRRASAFLKGPAFVRASRIRAAISGVRLGSFTRSSLVAVFTFTNFGKSGGKAFER